MKNEIASRQAFAKLYEMYAPMVYRRCFAMLKDDAMAKDIMQNVFLRIFERVNSLDLSKPSSLFWNTATRLCLNKIRDDSLRGIDVTTEDLLLQIASVDENEFFAKDFLAKIFSKEQESTRTMAVLHYVDGMSLEEVALAVGLSVSGVRKRLRALKSRIKCLEEK